MSKGSEFAERAFTARYTFIIVQLKTFCHNCGKTLVPFEKAFYNHANKEFDGCVRCCGGGEE